MVEGFRELFLDEQERLTRYMNAYGICRRPGYTSGKSTNSSKTRWYPMSKFKHLTRYMNTREIYRRPGYIFRQIHEFFENAKVPSVGFARNVWFSAALSGFVFYDAVQALRE